MNVVDDNRLARLESALIELTEVVRSLRVVTPAPEPVEAGLLAPADACRVLGIGDRKMADMLRLTADRGALPGIVDTAAPGAERRRWRWRSEAEVQTWADAVWSIGKAPKKQPKARRPSTPEPPRTSDGSVDFNALARGLRCS